MLLTREQLRATGMSEDMIDEYLEGTDKPEGIPHAKSFLIQDMDEGITKRVEVTVDGQIRIRKSW